MEKHRYLSKTIDMERTYVYTNLFNKDMCFRLVLEVIKLELILKLKIKRNSWLGLKIKNTV